MLQKYVKQVQKAIMSYSLHICFTLAHTSFPGGQEISIREFSPATACSIRDLKHTYIFMVKPYGIYG